jgi:hypothetical protein
MFYLFATRPWLPICVFLDEMIEVKQWLFSNISEGNLIGIMLRTKIALFTILYDSSLAIECSERRITSILPPGWSTTTDLKAKATLNNILNDQS